jgi:drug/metabolite transporter (DMT)-like permease
MFMYIFSIIIIVASNVIYNICSKSIPEKANPFSALFITYIVGALVTVIAFRFYKTDKGFFDSLKDLNWASFVLSFSIVGLEFGYIMAYRAGWNISIGSLVANILLALMLIPIGIFLYKEDFSMTKVFGIILCIVGLIFINKK